jgi:hypothetical protein
MERAWCLWRDFTFFALNVLVVVVVMLSISFLVAVNLVCRDVSISVVPALPEEETVDLDSLGVVLLLLLLVLLA